MAINEKGEFTRDISHNEKGEIIRGPKMGHTETEKNPEYELVYLKESLLSQSIHPDFTNQPEGIFFWKGARLEHNKELFKKMQDYAELNNIDTITDPSTGETTVLSDFFEKIDTSISYSENMRIQLENHKIETSEEEENEKAKLRKMLWDKLQNK